MKSLPVLSRRSYMYTKYPQTHELVPNSEGVVTIPPIFIRVTLYYNIYYFPLQIPVTKYKPKAEHSSFTLPEMINSKLAHCSKPIEHESSVLINRKC